MLESRNLKLVALQIPLFLLLAFSLVNLDLKVSIAGFTVEGARGLREILLLIFSTMTLFSAGIARQLGDANEIMKAVTEKVSGGEADVKNFLDARYGLAELSILPTFDPSLQVGRFHIVMGILAAVPYVLAVVAIAATFLTVQFLSLREIWLRPNYSPNVSMAIIAYVVATDLATLIIAWLHRGWQPLQTLEDAKRLDALAWKDKAKYDGIIEDIATQHVRRGFFSKLLFRPHMPRIK